MLFRSSQGVSRCSRMTDRLPVDVPFNGDRLGVLDGIVQWGLVRVLGEAHEGAVALVPGLLRRRDGQDPVAVGLGGGTDVAGHQRLADLGHLGIGVGLGEGGGRGVSGSDHLVLVGRRAVDDSCLGGDLLAVLGVGGDVGDAVSGLEVLDGDGLGVGVGGGVGGG